MHVVGRNNLKQMQLLYKKNIVPAEQGRVTTVGFISDVYRFSGAADLIISRAGATNLAEFAMQGKACIIIPSPFLTGGHQLKNAQILADDKAVEVIDEAKILDDPNRLAKHVSLLIKHPEKLLNLANNFSRFAKPNATHDLSCLLLKVANDSSQKLIP